MKYLVSYDIKKGNSYTPITSYLEMQGAERLLQSQWVLLKSNTTALELLKSLWEFLESDDAILVNDLDTFDAAGMNLLANFDGITNNI